MNIIDKIAEVAARCKPARARSDKSIRTIIVHRFGPKENGVQIYGAEDAAAFFAANPSYTGGSMAYHFVVRDDGYVEQALPCTQIAYHALAWNPHSIGIAAIGDFRYSRPGDVQYRALVELCAHLCVKYNISVWEGLRGHDECKGGSKDPYKKCPGRQLDMSRLRNDVVLELPDE